jgi:protein required for attachment to host cells
MPTRAKLLYLLADGASARLVKHREQETGFVTVREFDGRSRLAVVRAEQRDEAAGRSYESATSARHGVGREDGAYRRAKEAFAAEAAQALDRMIADGDWEGVVLVAPARLLPALRSHLAARTKVVRTLAKDLLKVPDHELGRWLDMATLPPAG